MDFFYFRHVILPKVVAVWRVVCYPIIMIGVLAATMTTWVIITLLSYFFAIRFMGRELLTYEEFNAIFSVYESPLIILVSSAITFFIIWILQRKAWKGDGFWKNSRISIYGIAICALAGTALNFSAGGMVSLTGVYAFFPEPVEWLEVSIAPDNVLQVLSVVIIAPFLEETIYRGIVLKRLMNITNKFYVANIIQALLYGVWQLTVSQSTYIFFLGLILGWVYVKYRTIWAPIVIRITFNLTYVLGVGIWGWSVYFAELSRLPVIIITIASVAVTGLFIYKISKLDISNDEEQLKPE